MSRWLREGDRESVCHGKKNNQSDQKRHVPLKGGTLFGQREKRGGDRGVVDGSFPELPG